MPIEIDREIKQINMKLDLLGLPAVVHGRQPVSRLRLPIKHPSELTGRIEHTLLRPEAKLRQVEELCHEASTYGFHGVCIHPTYIKTAVSLLRGTACSVITVVGFPHGATLASVKAVEAEQAVQLGATEIDMVIPIGFLKDENYAAVYEHISGVVAAATGKQVKVIIETALLSLTEKIVASIIAVRAGASFVKTSTGFASAGATAEDVALLRKVVPDHVGIKAAGGIRDLKTALAMIESGADRLGCSSSISIIKEFTNDRER